MKSHAKLNWYLRILDKREDGYHNLETVFQELEIADELEFTATPSESCVINGFPQDVPTESNLIYKAWLKMRETYPAKVGGLSVWAKKRLPRGGGLGGGSSNAAAAINAINELFNLKSDRSELHRIGGVLGSDVPFFLEGGCSVGHGRGELIGEKISLSGPFHLVLVFPQFSVSTADAYRKLSATPRTTPDKTVEDMIRALRAGNPEILAKCIFNDFEAVLQTPDADGRSFSAETWFSDCIVTLDRAGALRSFLCGSGSTVAALAEDFNHAASIASDVGQVIPWRVQAVSTT